MTKADNNRRFVNATSFEESITNIIGQKAENFEDIVFGILQDSGLHSTPMIKSLLKKLIDSGFTDTEQAIFTGALVASCVNHDEIKSWFSEQNIEFLIDIDDYGFILEGTDPPAKETTSED